MPAFDRPLGLGQLTQERSTHSCKPPTFVLFSARAEADPVRRFIFAGAFIVTTFIVVLGVAIWNRYAGIGIIRQALSDEDHFKYGSIGAEVNGYPFLIWRELPTLFPDKLPKGWETVGFIQEPGNPLPVGISVRRYGVDRVGFNCATCHTSTVTGVKEIFLGAPAQTIDLQSYLNFLADTANSARLTADAVFDAARKNGREPDILDRLVFRWYVIPKLKSQFTEISANSAWMKLRPPQGPGRTDAGNPWRAHFGLHPERDELVGTVDMPSLWNQQIRGSAWLHWDGNNNSLAERNLSAALAGGATEDSLDHSSIERVAKWALSSQPPKYPFPIDLSRVARGQIVYRAARCDACHDPGGARYGEVTPLSELGGDPDRLTVFSEDLLQHFAIVGQGRIWQFRHYRKTDGYANAALDGIWLRAPYMHNGSIPTLFDLLSPEERRPKSFNRGCSILDEQKVGFVCSEGFILDTTKRGNANGGHRYGTDLSDGDREDLIEYLKTK